MTAIVRTAQSPSFNGLPAPLRLVLLGSTALVGLALLTGQANAQALPDLANAGGAAVTFNGAGDAMNVDLGGASRVIDFNTYNIAAGNSANYSTTVPSATDLVAVNRVITSGGGPSLIEGTITAGTGISVWLINQEGISYNGSASLSGGSLMLSTLGFADAVDGAFRTAFAAPGAATGNAYRFAGGSAASPIVIGGNLNVAGSIVAVGQQIATNGALTAANGSVVLVAASDVTFSSGLGNPLSFTVNAGTQLGGAVNVNNALTGQSVVVAGGVQNSMTAALLNVSTGAGLTATAVNGTVTLATASTGGIAITNGAGTAPSIAHAGALVADGTGGSVVINSAGNLTGNGTIAARVDADVTTAGNLTAPTGSYTAAEGVLTVAAGGSATLGALTAGTDIAVSTTANAVLGGAVNAGSDLVVVSFVDTTIGGAVTAGGDISLIARRDTTINGVIDGGGTYSLETGRDLAQQANVTSAGNSTIDVGRNANMNPNALNASSGGSLAVDVGGDATMGALEAAINIDVETGGQAYLSQVDAGNDFSVTAGTDTAMFGGVEAGRDVTVTSFGNTYLTGDLIAGRDYVVTNTNYYYQLGNARATRNVDLTINGFAEVYGNIQASNGVVDISSGSGRFMGVTAGSDVLVSSAGDLEMIGTLTAGRDIDLAAGGNLFVRTGVQAGRDYLLEADAIGLGTAAGGSWEQSAVNRVYAHASSGNIVGEGDLTVSAGSNGTGNLELQADAGEVRFGADTALVVGLLGLRGDVIVTSAPNITLGDVTAARLYTNGDAARTTLSASGTITTGNLAIDNALTITSTGGSVTTGSIQLTTLGAALQIYAGGATGDVTSTGTLNSVQGNVLVSAGRDVNLVGGATTGLTFPGPVTGSIGLHAGRAITAGTLVAGVDIAANAAGDVDVTTAQAGDDIDFVSTGGNVSLGTGTSTALGTGSGPGSLTFSATPGQPGAIGAGPEDPQLGQSTIRLRAQAGDVTSATQLTTADGDLIVNAGRDVSLNGASASGQTSGGAIAVRAGRDVTRAVNLTSASDDVAIGAGRNAVLGMLAAPDDIDITVGGSLSWNDLHLLNYSRNTARFVDVSSGIAGTPGGVTFSAVPDAELAGGNVVRIRAGSIGAAAGAPDGLIAGTVTSGAFTANALSGDIRIGNIDASGNVSITADQGSVTGLPAGYAPATGGTIGSGGGPIDTVLLNVTGTAAIGAINATTVRTTGNADTLRIGAVTAITVDLGAVQTLDVGSVVASGSVDLVTTGGTAAPADLEIIGPASLLAPGFGAANLSSSAIDGLIGVSALNGVAQFGVVRAGTGTGVGGLNQLTVDARALTIAQADARDGSLAVTASDGLLSLDTGTAKQHVSLVKRNDDGASAGSPAATDILKVGNTTGTGGSITAGFGVDIRSETSLVVNRVTAQGNTALDRDVFVSAAGDMLLTAATATRGAIGLLAGGAIRGDVESVLPIVPGALTAAGDVSIRADGDVQYRTITTGDDVDIVSNIGDVIIRNITATGAGTGGTSIAFLGEPGAAGSLAIATGEDAALAAGSNIRLRAASGSIRSSETTGIVQTQQAGNILFNAANAVSVVDATASNGSIGIFAGGIASAATLRASRDIGIQGNAGISANRTNAGDDIDLFSPFGNIVLNNAIGTGNWSTINATSVFFTGAAGTQNAVNVGAGEEAQLTLSAIRLRAAIGDVVSSGFITGNGSTDVFINAGREVRINGASAGGSLGILAGGAITTGALSATKDIGVQGGTLGAATPTNITITDADTRDDIDVTALNGDLTLTRATARGDFGYGGTSVGFTAAAGTAGAVAVIAGETAQFANGTVSLRSQVGDVSSIYLATLRGDALLNAAGDVSLDASNIQGGSLAVLAGGSFTGGNLALNRIVIAEGDISVRAGTFVSIGAINARDDMDIVALGGNLAIINGSTGGGVVVPGTSVVFTGAAGTAGAIGTVTGEDAQLSAHTMRLRAETGDVISSGTLSTQSGNVLINAFGNASLNIVDARSPGAAGDVSNVGILAGGSVSANALFAARDIGIQSGGGAPGGIAIGTAAAGDDIDLVAVTGDITLSEGTTLAGANAGNTSVVFTGAAGTHTAVGTVASEDAQLAGATIRLRAAAGDVISANALQSASDVLVNASGDVTLAAVEAGSSIGVLAGGRVTAVGLTAGRDIGAQAQGNVTIAAATAGDDIDVASLTGTLDLTDGTATGSGAGGTSVVFTAAPGTAGAVGIAAPEDAQLAGATIRLRAAAGDIISANMLQSAGDVLVNASGNVTLATAQTTAGSIGVLAGGRVAGSRLVAARDIGIQAGTGVTIADARADDDIDMVALAGNVSLTNGTSTGLGGGGTSVLHGGAAGAANAVGFGAEDSQLAGSTIRLRAATGDVTSAGSLLTLNTGEVLVNAGANASLASVNAGGGSIGVLAGGLVSATTLVAARDIGVQAANGVTITDAAAGDDLDVAALNGNLALTNGASTALGTLGSLVTFTGTPGTATAVGIGAEDAQMTGSTIRLRAQAGDVTSTGALQAQGSGNLLVSASDAITLNTATVTAGSIGLVADWQVTAATLSASRDIGVQAGTGIAIGSAAAGDDIDMLALAGNLVLANGTSQGTNGAGGNSVTYATAPGTAASIGVAAGEDAQMGGATIRLRAANGNVSSAGSLRTQGIGDVLVNARGDLTLAAATASAGSSVLLAGGGLTAATIGASEDVAARAGANAALGPVTAGDDIEIAAGGLVTTASGTIGGAATGLDARHAVLDAALAGQGAGIALAAGDTRGPKGLPAGSALANAANGRNIAIEAANVDVQGVLDSTAAGRITLRNTGTGPTLVGDGTLTSGVGFALGNAEVGRLRSGTLVVDSGSRALELGTLTIGTSTGSADTRFLATGGVEITGALNVAGTAERTLQIGGLLGELGDNAGAVPLATSLIARIDRASRPGIDAGAAHVDLRAEKILVGTSTMIDEYIGMTNDQIAAIVANPSSKLYSEAAAQPLDVFLTAKRVTVGYKNFALFQNTDINRSAGVLINSPTGGMPDQTALALRLVSTGEEGNNSFAMFGVVNNFSGTPAALLTNEAIEIVNPTGDPNDFRVTRASSRINGCVIGAPDRGCLATDIPQPNFNLYDERKIALFDVDDDTTIAISPLIGRGNDGLIVNVADAPIGIDTIECRPEDSICPAKEGK